MSSSLVMNDLHIIYATKNLRPIIHAEIRRPLYNYLGAVCGNLNCSSIAIGGHIDHVHILCSLSKKIPLVDLLEEIKSSSSKWVKTLGLPYRDFYWQSGYGAFSINHRDREIVKAYIENQEEHHKHRSFKDEYLDFLREYGVQYDERYLWTE